MSIDVSVTAGGRIQIIRFADEGARNRLSSTVLDSLNNVLENLKAPGSVETLVFTGSGNSFASGANIREIAAITSEGAPDFARRGQTLMHRIANLKQKTMAAINGFCYGGGLDLALACDHRIALPSATFAHPGTGLGIITGWGGTQRLPRLIGRGNALEMFFTAEAVTAERAICIGLVDLVTDDLFNNELLSLKR